MSELARLRRRVRLLLCLVVILGGLTTVAFLRSDEAPVAAPVAPEEVAELKDRLQRSSYRERVRMLHQMSRGGWGGRAEQAVIEMLRSARTRRERLQAVEQLGRVGGANAVAELSGMLDSGPLQLRRAALTALGRIGSKAAVEQLISVVKQGEGRLMGWALSALGKAGGEAAVKLLSAAVADRRFPDRHSAISALGEAGGKEAYASLEKLIRDPLPAVQRAAISAMGVLGSAEARLKLMQVCQEGTREQREEAVSALASFSGDDVQVLLASLVQGSDRELARQALRALGQTPGPLAEQALLAAAQGKDAMLREEALSALGDTDAPEAEATLLSALETGQDPYTTVHALAAVGTAGAKSALLGALAQGNIETQEAVLNVVEGLGGKEVDAALRDLVKGGAPRVAARALTQLAAREGVAAMPSLLQAYREGSHELKAAAFGKMVEMNDPRVEPLLMEVIKKGDPNLSSVALDTLVRRGGDKALKVVTDAFTDGPAGARNSAAYALAQLGGDRAREVLLKSIRTDEDNSQAVWALGQMKDPRAVEALAGLMDDTTVTESVRQGAVQALASAGNSQALLRAANHPDKKVAVTALQNMGGMGGPEVERMLLTAASSGDDDKQFASIMALGQLGTPKAVDTLIASLSNDKLADQSANMLSNIGGKKVDTALASAYQRGDTRARESILQNMGSDPGPQSRRLLMRALDEGVESLTLPAVNVLARLGDDEARTRMVTLMQSASSSKQVRYAVASSLKWGDAKAYREHKVLIDKLYESGGM